MIDIRISDNEKGQRMHQPKQSDKTKKVEDVCQNNF